MRQLTSWREIAEYLGINVRTAQRYEAERGLPIVRDGNRVTACTDDLDRWKRSAALNGPWWENLKWLRIYCVSLTAIALAAAAGILGYRLFSRLAATPAGWRWDDRTLVVTDQRGLELWRHTFAFEHPSFAARGQRVWIADLDGDETRETLVSQAGTLYCFSEQGKTQWTFGEEPLVRARDGLSGERFVAVFRVLRAGGIAVDTVHWEDRRCRAVLLDNGGRELAEHRRGCYGDVMQTLEVADRNGDGREEILLAGFDPERNQAMLVELDASGQETARVWFPRSRKNIMEGPANSAYDVRTLPDGATQVQVREKTDRPRPFLVYLLGADLTVQMVEASWTMWNWDHSLTERELEELGRAVQIARGMTRREGEAGPTVAGAGRSP